MRAERVMQGGGRGATRREVVGRRDHGRWADAAGNKVLLLRKANVTSTMHPHHEAVRDALRHVAGMDSDRARERNGVGFSKYDNERGHALANATEYGDRELAQARGLVNKYRRQIPAEMHERIKATEGAKPKEPLPAGAHWITTPSKASAPDAGTRRHILIDGEGRILGGSLPKAAQGKHLSDWWKEQKAPEPHLHQHLREQGTAFAHHEDRTLTTGHGYQETRGRYGPEAAPGHVHVGLGSGEYRAPAGYLTLASAFADKERVKAIGGRWGPSIDAGKAWFLPISRLPRLLQEFPHVEVSAKAHDAYQDWAEKRAPAKDAPSTAKAPEKPQESPNAAPEPQGTPSAEEDPFTLPEGMNRDAMTHGDLHNYQKDAVRFLLQQKRAILGHAVGLGKTLTAITAAKTVQQKESAGPFMVLCPSSRKYGWADEIEKFAPGTKTVVLDASLTPKRQAERWAQIESEKPDFIITNYETLQKPELAEKLHALAPNVIADEAHKVKNRKAKTTAGFKQWDKAKYAWLLTATPMPNGQPEETYTMLAHVMGPRIGSWTQFGRDHVHFEDVRTPFGTVRKPVALKNVPALRQKVASAVQIKSMTDPDVGLQLPDRRRVDVSLDMGKDQQKMYDALAAEIAEEVEGMSPDAFSQAAASVMVKLKRLEQVAIDPDLVRPAEERTGELSPKESWAVETIADHLEDTGNRGVVLFCDMRLPLDKISDSLRKQGVAVAHVTGSQSPAERQQVERDFSAGKVKVVLATSAAEEGMNLQHGGHTLIHLDAPWVPKSVTQREGRVHRQGQPSPFTTHYHVTARGSVEARKQGTLREKARDIDALLGTHGAEDMAVGRALSRAEVLRMLRGEEKAKKSLSLELAGGDPLAKSGGERWVTIGGHADGDEKHKDGTPVLIDAEGHILAGRVPRAFQGLTPSQLADDETMQRLWKQYARAKREAQAKIDQMEQSIPRLARHMEAEDDRSRRMLVEQIRRASEGNMIAPRKGEEWQELPGYVKRSDSPWTFDMVAESMGITENELMRRIAEAHRKYKSRPTPEQYMDLAADAIHSDPEYEAQKQLIHDIDGEIGRWRGPRRVSKNAEKTRRWRERLKAEGRAEKRHERVTKGYLTETYGDDPQFRGFGETTRPHQLSRRAQDEVAVNENVFAKSGRPHYHGGDKRVYRCIHGDDGRMVLQEGDRYPTWVSEGTKVRRTRLLLHSIETPYWEKAYRDGPDMLAPTRNTAHLAARDLNTDGAKVRIDREGAIRVTGRNAERVRNTLRARLDQMATSEAWVGGHMTLGQDKGFQMHVKARKALSAEESPSSPPAERRR